MGDKESFAERMLRKQGWKKGQGLGKTEQGITEAIKPTLKFDNTGIGHDMAKEFTTNWWDMAYKKAANKIEVEEKDGGEIEVKAKKSKKRKREERKEAKNRLYSSFTKSATLSDGRMVEEAKGKKEDSSSSEDDEAAAKVSAVMKVLSDEELFKAVGVTAHKGARHGVTMSAKLKRVELSDQKYLKEKSNKKR